MQCGSIVRRIEYLVAKICFTHFVFCYDSNKSPFFLFTFFFSFLVLILCRRFTAFICIHSPEQLYYLFMAVYKVFIIFHIYVALSLLRTLVVVFFLFSLYLFSFVHCYSSYALCTHIHFDIYIHTHFGELHLITARCRLPLSTHYTNVSGAFFAIV